MPVRQIAKQVALSSVAVMSLLGLGATLASSGAPIESASGARTSDGRCPSASGQEVVQTVPLPGRPGFLLLTKKTLWVAIPSSRNGGHGRVVRIDPRSGNIQGAFSIPVNPYRLALGFGSLWITGESTARRYQGVVLRVDPRSGRLVRIIRGPRLFGAALATTSDAVWVGGADIYARGQWDKTIARLVFKIDPLRNAVVRRIHLTPTTVIDLAGHGRSLLATGWGAVVELSPSGRLLFQQAFRGSGWSIAVTPGTVWVAQPFSWNRNRRVRPEQKPARRLLRITTAAPRRLTVVDLDTPPGDVSAAAGVVWVGAGGGIARIDGSQTVPTLTKVAADVVPNRIEAFRGGAWVGERHANELRKIC